MVSDISTCLSVDASISQMIGLVGELAGSRKVLSIVQAGLMVIVKVG